MSAIPALGKLKEGSEFNASLKQVVSSSLTWPTNKCPSKVLSFEFLVLIGGPVERLGAVTLLMEI